MFGNGRKTIGVFVTQVHQEFQETLSRGICTRAGELGYNVAFFTNFLGYGELQYESNECKIANLPSYDKLDGIILLPDTMFVQGFETAVSENIKKFSHCPVVSVRQKIDEYYNVLINDDTVLDQIMRHFIVHHRYRKINFLTGPKENPVSIQRLESFQRVLREYGIPYEEERIFYGDFYKYLPYDAVRQWFSDPKTTPEAIICANDYMAITVCNALMDMGISVPEDIAVSGCDNINIAEDFFPSITTAGMPVYEMGIAAVDKIYQHNEGIPQEKITYLETLTKIRESCGCRIEVSKEVMARRKNRIINEMEDREKAVSNNAFMSVEFTSVKSIDQLDSRLASYAYMNTGFSNFYMCIHKDWDLNSAEDLPTDSNRNEMIMEVGMKNGEWLQKVQFDRPSLLPQLHVDQSPQIFYFNMLHYQENSFGYTAISFHGREAYKPSYQGWLINICNALENIRINYKLNKLVYKLEDMSIKDELTGLYNRRALDQLGKKYLEQCIEKDSKLMVFTADMDKLKFINDNFGHAHGDIAIKVVANALKTAAEDDEICIRIGGDEFVVIGLEYDEDRLNHFLEVFEREIETFNKAQELSYQVYVSYGWNIIRPAEDTTMEECLGVADSRMYRSKYEKKELQLKQPKELI